MTKYIATLYLIERDLTTNTRQVFEKGVYTLFAKSLGVAKRSSLDLVRKDLDRMWNITKLPKSTWSKVKERTEKNPEYQTCTTKRVFPLKTVRKSIIQRESFNLILTWTQKTEKENDKSKEDE